MFDVLNLRRSPRAFPLRSVWFKLWGDADSRHMKGFKLIDVESFLLLILMGSETDPDSVKSAAEYLNQLPSVMWKPRNSRCVLALKWGTEFITLHNYTHKHT